MTDTMTLAGNFDAAQLRFPAMDSGIVNLHPFGSPEAARRLEFFGGAPTQQLYNYMSLYGYPLLPPPQQPFFVMNPYGALQQGAIKAPSPRTLPQQRLASSLLGGLQSGDASISLEKNQKELTENNQALSVSKLLNRDYATIKNFVYSGDRVGVYDLESRRARIERYRKKRSQLNFKQVRYESRANICQKRERVGGRFVKTSEVIRADAPFTKRQRSENKKTLGRKRLASIETSFSTSSRDASSLSSVAQDEDVESVNEMGHVAETILRLKAHQ